MIGRRGFLWGSAAAALAHSRAAAFSVEVGRFRAIPFERQHHWSAAGGGNHRAYRAGHAVPTSAPSQQWSQALSHRSVAPICLGTGVIYVSTRTHLHSYDLQGQERSRLELACSHNGPVASSSAGVVVELANQGLAMVRGRQVRLSELGPISHEGLLPLHDGTVVCYGGDRVLRRVRLPSEVMFSVPLEARAVPHALASDGRAIMVSSRQGVTYFDFRGRRTRHVEVELRSGARLTPDGGMWVGDRGRSLVAFDAEGNRTGQVPRTITHGRFSQYAVAQDGTLRAVIGGGDLVAFERTGQERWRYTHPQDRCVTGVIGDGGTTVVLTRGARMVCIGSSGEVRWETQVGAPVRVPPVLIPEGILLLTANGFLQLWS